MSGARPRSATAFSTRQSGHMGSRSIPSWAFLLALMTIACLAALPFALENYAIRLATMMLMYGVLAWGWKSFSSHYL